MSKCIFITNVLFILLFSAYSHADPMGLSNYVVTELYSSSTTRHDSASHVWHDRRLTNHEVALYKATGFINQDGSVSAKATQIHQEPINNTKVGSNSKMSNKHGKRNSVGALKHVPQEKPIIRKKPLPTHKDIAKLTKTKHKDNPGSNGTIKVRPVNFPDNPSRDDIVRMQQHIQHIERTVGKALDLSLSAYAVAELPQATEGRSGISLGLAANDGKSAEAIGFSSNFGDKHEYTVKVSLSHAGHEDAVGAGFNWQW